MPEAAVADDYDDAGGSWKGLAGAVAVLAVAMVAFVKLRNPGPPPASAVFRRFPNELPPPATAPPLKKKGSGGVREGTHPPDRWGRPGRDPFARGSGRSRTPRTPSTATPTGARSGSATQQGSGPR